MAIGTYEINWSDTAVGKDLVFDRPGYSIDHADIPASVGASGSLRWPALGHNANCPVTLTLTLASAGVISLIRSRDSSTRSAPVLNVIAMCC